jgi:catechol 2,3-dioxygenase-like lactoylglutathione lyase family enzyme
MTDSRRSIAMVSILVPDYQAGIDYYCRILGFELSEDTLLEDGKRWVRVTPGGGSGFCLLLARAVGPRQHEAIGDQSGGRVFLFLETSDFAADYALYAARGVKFREQPRNEDYGIVAVFEDAFGNLWDLIEPRR